MMQVAETMSGEPANIDVKELIGEDILFNALPPS